MNTKRRFIFLIILTSVIYTTYGFSLWMLHKYYTKTRTLIIETAVQEQKVQSGLTLKIAVQNSKEDIEALSKAVIPSDGGIPFIEFVESLGKQYRVVTSIASAEEKKVGGFNQLSFRLTVDGSWSNIIRFIELLEVAPYRISFKNVGVSTIGKTWRGSIDFVAIKAE